MERIRNRTGRTYFTRSGAKRVEGSKFQQNGERVDNKSTETFINPYSYESNPEARVQLELESRGIPFAYRYFVTGESAIHVKRLIPDFAPEFTLPDYKVVIMVIGDFYGHLPGVLDKDGLAVALLAADGWKGIVWDQSEIVVEGVAALMHRDLPQLDNCVIGGIEIPSPYGHPLTMETRRRYLRGTALLKKIFTPKAIIGVSSASSRVRRSHVGRPGPDGTRRRAGSRGPTHE